MNKLTPQDFIFMEKEIVKFNELMGNSLDDDRLVSTYQKLSVEEVVKELLPAYQTNDTVEILDALIDGAFVVFYWTLLNNPDNSLGKNLRWLEEDVCIDEVDTEDEMKNVLLALGSYIEKGDSFCAQTYLYIAISYYQTQFDIMGAFREVLRSNLSKFILNGTVDIQEEIDYIESVGRYSDITVTEKEQGGEIYLAFKALRDNQNDVTFDKPKLIKTRNFSEPQLEQFIVPTIKLCKEDQIAFVEALEAPVVVNESLQKAAEDYANGQ